MQFLAAGGFNDYLNESKSNKCSVRCHLFKRLSVIIFDMETIVCLSRELSSTCSSLSSPRSFITVQCNNMGRNSSADRSTKLSLFVCINYQIPPHQLRDSRRHQPLLRQLLPSLLLILSGCSNIISWAVAVAFGTAIPYWLGAVARFSVRVSVFQFSVGGFWVHGDDNRTVFKAATATATAIAWFCVADFCKPVTLRFVNWFINKLTDVGGHTPHRRRPSFSRIHHSFASSMSASVHLRYAIK